MTSIDKQNSYVNEFLFNFHKISGALDFDFFTDLKSETGKDDIHLEAVSKAMSRIAHGCSYSLEKATRTLITKEQFLGSCYCSERDDILLRGRTENEFLNEIFVGLDEEIQENIYGPAWKFGGNGFCYAFSDPPYSTGPKTETYRVYHFFLTHFLNNFKDDIEIYEWSDDWSNYFDMGKEWWGCFFGRFTIKVKTF